MLTKRLLPKQADDRSRLAVQHDLSLATTLYAQADRKVELARRKFCARLEAAHWERYQRAVEKMGDESIGYYEWLVKEKTLLHTYSKWGAEQVYYYFAGLHAEAQSGQFLKYGETELPEYWYMDGFNLQVAKREDNPDYGVRAKVIRIRSKFFVELVPTIKYEAFPLLAA